MAMTFTLTDEQEKQLNIWVDRHVMNCCKPGAIGDSYHLRICRTSIGDFITAHCVCGQEYDLNDWIGSF